MSESPANRTALVVFVDQTECRWLRMLSPGFRHCFAVVSDGTSWIVCDPLKDRIELAALRLPSAFDLADFYASQGHEVLVGTIRQAACRDRLALAPFTCVAMVKRILGVRAACILTPRQLFRHLSRPRGGAFSRCGRRAASLELDIASN